MCQADWIKKEKCFNIHNPVLVGPVATLIHRMRDGLKNEDRLLLGFDFPIGVPRSYASKTKIKNFNFRSMLPQFGVDVWKEFYNVCENANDIDVFRPFYPYRTGGWLKNIY